LRFPDSVVSGATGLSPAAAVALVSAAVEIGRFADVETGGTAVVLFRGLTFLGYDVAKLGVTRLTTGVAKDVAKDCIHVNRLAPAPMFVAPHGAP
jgi:NAD(P)-dependent dehydrogenase (short-subunit alcohol dehydrogenase family)